MYILFPMSPCLPLSFYSLSKYLSIYLSPTTYLNLQISLILFYTSPETAYLDGIPFSLPG